MVNFYLFGLTQIQTLTSIESFSISFSKTSHDENDVSPDAARGHTIDIKHNKDDSSGLRVEENEAATLSLKCTDK